LPGPWSREIGGKCQDRLKQAGEVEGDVSPWRPPKGIGYWNQTAKGKKGEVGTLSFWRGIRVKQTRGKKERSSTFEMWPNDPEGTRKTLTLRAKCPERG